MKDKGNANVYKVLHKEVDRIIVFYKWDCEDQTLEDYIIQYYGHDVQFITPHFNRNGFYQDRIAGYMWMEIDGLAFTHKAMKEQFKYDLERLNEKVYSRREVAAMRELVKMNTLSAAAMKEIRQALYNDQNRMQLWNIGLDSYKIREEIRREIKELTSK